MAKRISGEAPDIEGPEAAEAGGFGVHVGSTPAEAAGKAGLAETLRRAAIPDSELLDNLSLFLTRQALSQIGFIRKLYETILPVHGDIMEFGVRWGRNMALFSALRGVYEPFNYTRRVIGFDTFAGFPDVDAADSGARSGDYGVAPDWKARLERVLDFHEQNAPIAHKRKYALIEGDVTQTLPAYLRARPETVVALAYFDLDLHAPTKACLEAIAPHLTKGSVLAFDELNSPDFPGETLAVRETLGLSRYAIRRDPAHPPASYLVID